jgi:multiple sugar transport system permease protein
MIRLILPRRRLVRRQLTAPQAFGLAVLVILAVFPLYWMVVGSLKTENELLAGRPSLWPDFAHAQWGNYVDMWTHVDYASYLRNSLIICSLATIFATAIAILAGFALATFKFPGSGIFGLAVIATQLLPGILFLIPVVLIFSAIKQQTGLQLVDTYQGMVLLYVAFFVPLSIWILRGYFAAIPKELLEAALIDGATVIGALWRVILPLARAGIIATAAYIFLSAWDELLFAGVLTNSTATQTVPVGIRLYFGQYQNRYDLMMAATTITCLPPALIFLFLQRHMISGLTAGAVK